MGEHFSLRGNQELHQPNQLDMYRRFFGLREDPFNISPDPRYLYLTSKVQHALDTLGYGIKTRKGLILLTGEVGTGKTTLINRLLDWLHRQHAPAAFIFNPHLERRHLFDLMLADFGLPPDTHASGTPLMRLSNWLLERYRAGVIPVLIVDEAQGLSVELLEEIRLLLNLETVHEKLLQIVIAGQPELEETLKRKELRELRQRIALRCKTAPFTREETHAYIQTRLQVAGSNGRPVFTPEAMDALHSYAKGIPRVINVLSEHSLINAYLDDLQPVPASVVEQVAHEFELGEIGRSVPATGLEETADAGSAPAASLFAEAPVAMPSQKSAIHASSPVEVPNPAPVSGRASGNAPMGPEHVPDHVTAVEAIADAVKRETDRLRESAELTSEDAFRLLSAWALESVFAPSSSAGVAEPGNKLDNSAATQNRPDSHPEVVRRWLTAVGAMMQSVRISGGELVRRLQPWFNHEKAAWRSRRSSMVWSLRRMPWQLLLPQGLRTAKRRVWHMLAGRFVRHDVSLTTVFLGMWASLIRWLRQPWGQLTEPSRLLRFKSFNQS